MDFWINKVSNNNVSEKLHIYIRVSSDSQLEDGFGLQNQKEYGMKVSQRLGMEPIIHNEGSKSSSSHLTLVQPFYSVSQDLVFFSEYFLN